MDPHLIAIVPAAGVGARAAGPEGLPKQYRLLGGVPMLRRSVLALLANPRIAQVRVAVAPGDPHVAQALDGLSGVVWRPCGGPTRSATVLAALRDAGLPADAWVLVHDAARPGLAPDALARLIDTCLQAGRGGLLARPVADTVKRAAPEAPAQVCDTVAREHLWLAQTPQMFRAAELQAALQACVGLGHITDEASAIEHRGQQPLLVLGNRLNDKLTWPEDFDWFESCLRGQAGTQVSEIP
ncbi:2-C-methyl-D-erythritol 4-phosphate cytidylyltransferase [Castellaniella sp.]|uniref:2-C-methyl-D-erythritol 4-phosphate cytidylyltransferase n=1 Tax=Castellaniella sp. TaxID=1955812 RepID=UPI003C785E14